MGDILSKYADALVPFMQDRLRAPILPQGIRWRSGLVAPPTTLAQWILTHWPAGNTVPVPEQWSEIFAKEQRYLEWSGYRESRSRQTQLSGSDNARD
jgi:hypothetical protein